MKFRLHTHGRSIGQPPPVRDVWPRGAWLGLVLLSLSLSACAFRSPPTTGLHYVDETLVYSAPPDHRAYAAYLEARVAMGGERPDLERAWEAMTRALYYDRRDPHLWTTRGELAMLRGELDVAFAASKRALELRPGYPPARELVAKIRAHSAKAPATAKTAERVGGAPGS